ncbi:glycosyltransferase [Shouchella clausii]|uniref:glycosyltransferase n=1 Tax=Shouchella clausii TaxID=79880 RepID=UPI000BA6539D|nr:glycosyltransferase [Shouchella clausii]PAD14862.1 hypothetical protein CHH74_07800 [Shouchella clausii]
MIFVTLGTQKFKMDRVIHEIDRLVNKQILNSDEVIVQYGFSSAPKYCYSKKMIEPDEYENLIKNAEIIITHGGTSSIIKSLIKRKKVIAIPRLSEYGEHIDDHQKEIVNVFFEKNYISMLTDINLLEESLKMVRTKDFAIYKPEKKLASYLVENVLV